MTRLTHMDLLLVLLVSLEFLIQHHRGAASDSSRIQIASSSFVDSSNISRQIKIADREGLRSKKMTVYNEMYEMSESGHL